MRFNSGAESTAASAQTRPSENANSPVNNQAGIFKAVSFIGVSGWVRSREQGAGSGQTRARFVPEGRSMAGPDRRPNSTVALRLFTAKSIVHRSGFPPGPV